MTILQNKSNRRATVHAVANVSMNVSSFAVNANEVVDALTITQVMCSGNVAVQRGANVIVTCQTGASAVFNFMGQGMAIGLYPTANLTLVVNDAFSFVVVEVGKMTHGTPTEY